MRVGKVLLINAGQGIERAFRNIPGFKFTCINASDLHYHNLWGYDAVILSSWADQRLIEKHTHRLIDFAQKGGILVCLGCQAQELQWIPFCHWKYGLPQNASLVINSDDTKILFQKIDLNLLSFHPFIGHGSLVPPNNAKAIISADGEPVMCLVDEGISGAALITTIDPDWHVVYGMRHQDRGLDSQREQNANEFISNILKWCLWKFDQRHSPKDYFLRRFRGLFSFKSALLISAFATWIVTIIISLGYFFKKDYNLLVMIPGIASLIGLAIVLTDKLRGSK